MGKGGHGFHGGGHGHHGGFGGHGMGRMGGFHGGRPGFFGPPVGAVLVGAAVGGVIVAGSRRPARYHAYPHRVVVVALCSVHPFSCCEALDF